MDSPESDTFNDSKRTEKSLSLLTRKFVSLLLSSKKGILDLKSVSIANCLIKLAEKWQSIGLRASFTDIFVFKEHFSVIINSKLCEMRNGASVFCALFSVTTDIFYFDKTMGASFVTTFLSKRKMHWNHITFCI